MSQDVVYYYRLKQVDNNGIFKYSPVVSATINDGLVFAVSEFIPNPTTSTTHLVVTTTKEQEISIAVYNLVGQKIEARTQLLSAGTNNINFDYRSLPAGTYSTIIAAGNETYAKKSVVIK